MKPTGSASRAVSLKRLALVLLCATWIATEGSNTLRADPPETNLWCEDVIPEAGYDQCMGGTLSDDSEIQFGVCLAIEAACSDFCSFRGGSLGTYCMPGLYEGEPRGMFGGCACAENEDSGDGVIFYPPLL